MSDQGQTPQGQAREGSDDEWTVANDPAMRALLDHVAEELAAEFVRLMRAAVATEDTKEREEEDR